MAEPLREDPKPDELPREALVYVPGLNLGLDPKKTAIGVVTRLQRSCDTSALTGSARFTVQWYEEAVRKNDPAKPLATILRKDGEEEKPVVDVFEYAWSNNLTDRWQKQSLPIRAARTFFGVLSAWSFMKFFTTAGKKTPFGRAQLALAFLFVLFTFLYSVTVFWALGRAVQRVVDPPDKTTATASATAPAKDKPKSGRTVGLPEVVVIAGAALGRLATQQRDRARVIGPAMLSARSYLTVADGRAEVTRGLVQLAETLREDGRYETVRILGYSFGSIVAIDALYPTIGPPAHAFDAVETLVTIGSPYDFVRAVRKDWASGRTSRPGVPAKWVNVYAPIDLLGSNYRDDKADDTATVAVAPPAGAGDVVAPTENRPYDLGIKPTWLNLPEFYGFMSHGLYWARDDDVDQNVFDVVVPYLWEGTTVLA